MKQIYIFMSLSLITLSGFSQGYELGIIHNNDYNFSVIAIPDFDATDTDISDIGFALMLPAGDADVTNLTQFNNRTWSATEVTAAQLTGLMLGDGTRDGFAMNLPPGQTILSHTSGQEIVLISFDVSNMPIEGDIEILSNTDPIALGLGGAADSFYNSNIDSTTTQDYFSGLALGLESFMFSTLSVIENQLETATFNVFPNPASNKVTISASFKINTIELYNILGKKVLSTTNDDVISLEQFSSGVYFIRAYHNTSVITKRLVIEK